MSHPLSPVVREGDVIGWAAGRFFFVADVGEKKFLLERNDVHEAPIRCISTRNGRWATAGDDKKVISWSSWQPTVFVAQKKVTAVIQLEDRILFADRYGDVYSLQNQEASLLLGHLAIITQMILIANDTFLVTADNNDKIRVSRYPECYAIHSFCLGHTQHVIKLLPYAGGFISLGADQTLRVWSLDGKQKRSFSIEACEAVIQGDECCVLHNNQEEIQRINLTTGETLASVALPLKAQALLSDTIYISTTGHLESTTGDLSMFSGEDVETPLVHFGTEKENDEFGDENIQKKRKCESCD